MPAATIGEVLARQYDRVWGTLRDAISQLSDEQWRASECAWLAPVRQAYHLVETAEFYGGETSKGYKFGSLGGNWEESPAAELPAQQQVLELIDRVQPRLRRWLTECSDSDFLAEETDFQWTGGTRLDRALYSLRHSQHHLGQINTELRRRGLPRGKWA